MSIVESTLTYVRAKAEAEEHENFYIISKVHGEMKLRTCYVTRSGDIRWRETSGGSWKTLSEQELQDRANYDFQIFIEDNG